MLKANIAGVPHAYELTKSRTKNEPENRTEDRLEGSPNSSKTLSTIYRNKVSRPVSEPSSRAVASQAVASRTLVFVHGWMLSQAYWQPLVDLLADNYRCLTYDLRGFGDSTVPARLALQNRKITLPAGRTLPLENLALAEDSKMSADTLKTYEASPYSLAAYAQDLAALLDELGLDRVWLLGHSLGGSIALWAAYLLPERIQGIICINAGGGIYIPKEFDKFRSAGQQMVKYRPSWLQHLPLLPRVFARLMVRQPLAPRWGQERLRDFIRADRQAAVGSLLETTSQEEVHLLPQVVSQITQPAHFIAATEDSVMLPRYVHHLASFHPHFSEARSITEISNCGHMAMVEQPRAVADVVRAVLSSSDS